MDRLGATMLTPGWGRDLTLVRRQPVDWSLMVPGALDIGPGIAPGMPANLAG